LVGSLTTGPCFDENLELGKYPTKQTNKHSNDNTGEDTQSIHRGWPYYSFVWKTFKDSSHTTRLCLPIPIEPSLSRTPTTPPVSARQTAPSLKYQALDVRLMILARGKINGKLSIFLFFYFSYIVDTWQAVGLHKLLWAYVMDWPVWQQRIVSPLGRLGLGIQGMTLWEGSQPILIPFVPLRSRCDISIFYPTFSIIS